MNAYTNKIFFAAKGAKGAKKSKTIIHG